MSITPTLTLFARAALFAALALAWGACARSTAPSAPEPETAPEAATAPRPAVLIIAIDGLRPADVARADTPHLDELAREGAYTDTARAVMPTITRTNFVTFATGGYADEHGVIGGTYIDEAWEEQKTDGPTLKEAQKAVPIPTIFEVAEAKGSRTAMIAMKGYELVGARGASVARGGADLFPETIWAGRYDPNDGGSPEEFVRRRLRKNEVMIEELKAVFEEGPADLVLINLGATDYVAHQLGPDSEHYLRAIEGSDRMVGAALEVAAAAAPDRDWHVIVGTDHGFSQTGGRERLVVPHLEGVFEVDELEAAEIEHRIYERGGRAAELYLRDLGDATRAAELLAELPWVRRFYSEINLPGRAGNLDDLRVAFPGRHGSIYIITDPSYGFAYPNRGQHGSDDPEDQVIPLWLAGSRVAASSPDLAGASNLDIGPTALALLGIDPRDHLEGSGQSLMPVPLETDADAR